MEHLKHFDKQGIYMIIQNVGPKKRNRSAVDHDWVFGRAVGWGVSIMARARIWPFC